MEVSLVPYLLDYLLLGEIVYDEQAEARFNARIEVQARYSA